jgi:UDP-N-acetylmuramyl tripeptide synthase
MMLLTGIAVLRAQQKLDTGIEGRVGLLLGQAGNRSDEAIAELAQVAASANPDLIVVKEIASMLRGRASGDVPAMLKRDLVVAGYPAEKIHTELDEVAAAQHVLLWSLPGDIVVLPVHQSQARKALATLLDDMEARNWRTGTPLPAD